MDRLPVELLLVLGFIALVLVNYVTQRAARRRAAPEKAPAAAPTSDEEPPGEVWGRRAAAPSPAPAHVLDPRPSPPPVVSPRPHPVRALLKDKRDLRRAFVLVMVLGPCRAQEPSER